MSILYGIDDPGMTEEDFIDILEEFGRDCIRIRVGQAILDDNYGFKSGGSTTTLDSCDATTGWVTTFATAPTLDTHLKLQGNASINCGTSNVANLTFAYEKTITAVSGAGLIYYALVYITDVNVLASSGTALRLAIGSAPFPTTLNNYLYKDFTRAQLVNGWNLIGGLLSTFTSVGTPVLSTLVGIRVVFTKDIVTRTITSGDIKIDYLHLTSAETTEDAQTCIIVAVAERDAKLIDGGFANIGDFKVFLPYSYDTKSHDFIYDPMKLMYLELEELRSNVAIQITGICRIFIGKVTNRPIAP